MTTTSTRTAASTPAAQSTHRRRASWTVFAIAVGAAGGLPAVVNSYVVSVGCTAMVLAMVAISTQLLGVAGLPSLGQAGYLAIGAYTAALLATRAGVGSAPIQLVAAALVAAAVGALTAPLVLRTRAATHLMVTLAIAELVRTVASQWSGLTNGDNGLPTPPVSLVPGGALRAAPYVYWYLLGCFLLVAALVAALLRSPWALRLRASANHEPRLAALGHAVTATLFAGHVAAASIAGAAGALMVAATRYLSPADFTVSTSALALLAAAIGAGTMRGAVAAAVLIVAVRDLIGARTGGHALALLGLVFVLVAYRPALSERLRPWWQGRRR
ncbi:MAG TPA: branched-chain amino acid ABC transporter permease [Micromonosporaceae bacterium]|jgi:branched-chain amino acid transport system permease protein